tara:strand:+ start:206 stop:436 length:231 start_codon:yes stop_codon:yes gene_type:complete
MKKLTKKEIIDKLAPEKYCMKNNKIICSFGGFNWSDKNANTSLICTHLSSKTYKFKLIKKYIRKVFEVKAPDWCPL